MHLIFHSLVQFVPRTMWEKLKVGYLVNETRDSSLVTLVSGLTLRMTKLMQRGEF